MNRRTNTRIAVRAVLGMAAAAATGVILAGQFGRTHHLLDQFNSTLSLLLPVLAVTFAVGLRIRDRATIAVAALGLAVGGFQLGGAALESGGRGTGSGPELKVVTFSTFHANREPHAIVAVLAAEAPDVAVLQETDGTAAAIMDEVLPGYYRIVSCRSQRCPLTILSRWPARRVEIQIPPRTPHADVMMAQVDAPFGAFRIANVHMPRPYAKHAQAMLDRLAALGHGVPTVPLIVAGDFNTATGSFGLDRFGRSSGLRRQERFIPTYPANRLFPAFAGIDHIFANPRWSREGCHRTGAGHSDHYGVACRLRLREPR